MRRQKILAKLAVLLLVLLLIFLLFRPNYLAIGGGERVFTFQLPGETQPGGSAGADLLAQLQERHGEDILCRFHYLGRDFGGRQYIYCIVDVEAQTLRYIAVDDGDAMSEKRAEILWDTIYEGP